MATMKTDEDVDDKEENHEGKHPEGNLLNFEPEVPVESMLVPTDNFDSFEQEAPPNPSNLKVHSNLAECQNNDKSMLDGDKQDPDTVILVLNAFPILIS